MSDPALSAALQEAFASAPVDDIIHHTLEFRHAAFAEPIRVVRDHADLTAALEADAPENPAEAVLFAGYGFTLQPPDVTTDPSPTLGIEIDNVDRTILAAVEASMVSTGAIEVTHRIYLASDLTAPQNDPPLTLTVAKINADLMRVRAGAGFADLANKKFPASEFSAESHPGLIQQ
jgi:hypothetical protein